MLNQNYQNYIFQIIRIMTEQDSFYQSLPYTLPIEQCSPPFVIFGTGLQECLLAAYFAKMTSKIGLIIDTDKSYGSCLKTVTFKELHELNTHKTIQKLCHFITPAQFQASNDNFYNECVQKKKHRGYNIDLQPSLFFGSSITCECLKEADMDKYMDFRLVSNILHIHENQLKPVPLSKGKIFQSKQLSLLEKKTLLMSLHKLIKIYQKYMKIEQDINSTKEFDKDFGDFDQKLYKQFTEQQEQYFLPFVQKLVKKNKKILDYLVYIICNYQYSYKAEIPIHAKESYKLKNFIKNFGKFIKSCGIYGQSPYLYVDNGIGDIPQAFSRIASIYGSTYVLHPKIEINKIEREDNKIKIHTNLSPQSPIVTQKIYYGSALHDLKSKEEQSFDESILRLFLICQKNGSQEECPSIAYLIDIQVFKNPVYLFMFDHSTHTCPESYILYQFEVIIANNQENLTSKIDNLIESMGKVRGQNFKSSIRYLSCFIRTRKYPKVQDKKDQMEYELDDTFGIDLDGHFTNFMKIVGTQEAYFRKEQAKNEEDEEPYGGYETNNLLQKLEQINLNETQQEKPKDQEIKQNKYKESEVKQERKNQDQNKVLSNQTAVKQAKIQEKEQIKQNAITQAKDQRSE